MLDGAATDARLLRLIRQGVERFAVDLHGLVVVTQADDGPFGASAVLAAVAGAQTWAVARHGTHADTEEIWTATRALAAAAGVDRRLHLVASLREAPVEACDVVTNAGRLQPVAGALAERLSPSAVVPLMYGSWRFRPGDVDLHACAARGALVLGTDEAAAGVVDFAGIMCLHVMLEAGIECRGSTLLVLDGCPFGRPVARDLRALGAAVHRRSLSAAVHSRVPAPLHDLDAIVVASAWSSGPAVAPSGAVDPRRLAQESPGAAVVQFLGDVDREAAADAGVRVWPREAPPWGHMGLAAGRVAPRAHILLHAASLAWAGVASRVRRTGGTLEAAGAAALATGLAEPLDAVAARGGVARPRGRACAGPSAEPVAAAEPAGIRLPAPLVR